MKKSAVYIGLSSILINARQKFSDLTDSRSFDIRYKARRKQSPSHKVMMLAKARAKRARKNAKRLSNNV